MNKYRITLEIDGEESVQIWDGYTEQVAIAQCFLSEAQNGARSLKVIDIEELQ